MRILLIGAGAVGNYLARKLSGRHEVTLIEIRKERCDFLRPSLPGVNLMCEDGCEPWVLEMAQVSETGLVVAVTGDDEDNLVISYLSKFEYEVPTVIVRVNNPLNRWLFTREWGVDIDVSVPDMIETVIEEEITVGEVVTLMKLQGSDVGLLEITVPDGSGALGKSLAELNLPPETLVVTVIRKGEMTIPAGSTILEPRDRILAVANQAYREELRRLLGT